MSPADGYAMFIKLCGPKFTLLFNPTSLRAVLVIEGQKETSAFRMV